MAKEIKKLIAQELKERLANVDGWVLVDTTGLDAHHAEDIRSELRSQGMQMLVIRNTLAKRVFGESGYPDPGDNLQGPTAIVFGQDGVLQVSKVLIPWRRKNKLLPVRAGLLDGEIVGPAEVERLSTIPDRPVLLAQLLSLLQGSIARLHRALGGPASSFGGILGALAKKREGDSG